eukprot:scaffold234658_cov30-Tisochrysis_lutea.AAC.2
MYIQCTQSNRANTCREAQQARDQERPSLVLLTDSVGAVLDRTKFSPRAGATVLISRRAQYSGV